MTFHHLTLKTLAELERRIRETQASTSITFVLHYRKGRRAREEVLPPRFSIAVATLESS